MDLIRIWTVKTVKWTSKTASRMKMLLKIIGMRSLKKERSSKMKTISVIVLLKNNNKIRHQKKLSKTRRIFLVSVI